MCELSKESDSVRTKAARPKTEQSGKPNAILALLRYAAVALLCTFGALSLSAGMAQAQFADIHNGGALNTDFNTSNTASGTIPNIGNGTGPGGYNTAQFDFGFSVTGGATWQGGVEFQAPSGLQQIWTQPTNTDLFDATPRTGTYTMNFTRGVQGLTFVHGGLDNDDGVLMEAFYQGNPVPLQNSYFGGFTGSVSLQNITGDTAFILGTGGGNADERANEYRVTFPANVLVDELTFVTAKEDGRAGTVTLAFYEFDWLPLTIDAEDDTGPTVSNNVAITGVVDVLADNGVGVDTLDDPNTPAIDAATAATVTVSATGPLPAGVTLNADGTVDLAAGVAPGPLVIPYEICEIANPTNCAPATLTMTVVSAPTADDDAETSATIQDVTVDPLANDTANGVPIDDTTVVLTGTGAPAGSVVSPDGKTLTVPNEGEWTVAANGEVTFAPVDGFTGDPTPAAYTVADTDGNISNEAEISIDYGDRPIASDDPIVSAVVETVSVNPLGNDSDADGTLVPASVVLTGTGAPAGATLSADGKTLTVPGEGEWTVNPTSGVITFEPEDGFAGDPTPAAYTVADDDGNVSNEAVVTVDFGDPPVANDDTEVSETIEPVTVATLANDSDADGSLVPASVVLTGTDAPSGSTLAADGKTLTVPGEGQWTVAANGDVTFTPEAGFASNPTPVTYTVEDDDGNTSNEATITVGYGEIPTATDDVNATPTAGPVVFDPLANDTAASGLALDPTSVVLTGTGAPAGSVLSADGRTLTVPGEGEWTVDPVTGQVTFTPEPGFTGMTTPAAYTVADENGLVSNEATLTATIIAPEIVAVDDGVLIVDDGDASLTSASVLNNDSINGATATLTNVTLTPGTAPTPAAGSIVMNADGTITAAAGTTPGTYTYPYEICEAGNPTNCATAEATIVVNTQSLVEEIEEDLIAIIEEDLAATLVLQSQQISGYSADALDRLRQRTGPACLADVNARLATENILFDTDKAIIKPESHRILDDIAAILQSCAGSAFEIAGHTDSDASDLYNIDLSQRRVEAVLQQLAARGVNTTGFVARGYGESRPIASNATEAGKAQNRRVEFLPLEDTGYVGDCHNGTTLFRKLDAHADEGQVTLDGSFERESHNCIEDARSVFEGTISYLDTDNGQEQSMVNLSYRREKFTDANSIFGYFVGLYGSRTDVSRLADGDIQGFGVNAGVYGADQLRNGLFVDYYLGGAVGQHDFDLAFDRDIGTIDATGDYQYLAGFAGAALSGELDLGLRTVTPRIGFDYIYSAESDVDVVATLDGVSQNDVLSLDSLSGGRVFLEVRDEYLINDGKATIALNPRIACYEEIGGLSGACGIGGSIEFASTDLERGMTYAVEIDGERGENYTLGSITGSVARNVGAGTLSGDVGVGSRGALSLGTAYELEF